jgi:hypothetical protein
MTPGMIDERLRALGIPDEYTARQGTEPLYVHVRAGRRVVNWYSTAPIGILMLKSDVRVMRDNPLLGPLTIELGRGG